MRETLLQFLAEISERANKLTYNDMTPVQKNSVCNTIQDAVGYIKKDVIEYLDYLEEENKRLYKENQQLLKMTHDAIYNGEHIDFDNSYPNLDDCK